MVVNNFTFSVITVQELTFYCSSTMYRDLPRALMIGIPLVTIVYLLTNIAYIAVVGGERILTSGAVAMVSESVSNMTCAC